LETIKELDNLIKDISSFSINKASVKSSQNNVNFTKPPPPPSSKNAGVEASINDLNKLVDDFDNVGASVRRSMIKKPASRREKTLVGGAADGEELNEILVLLGSRVIKGVDLNKISFGLCSYCKKTLLDEISETLDGLKYHPEHLFCSKCKNPTSPGKFYEHNKLVFCVSCFEGSEAPRCGQCQKPIIGPAVNAMNKRWHPEHFVCVVCGLGFLKMANT